MLCVDYGVVHIPYFVYFEVASIIIMWNDFQLNIICALYDVDTNTCTVYIYSWGIYVISVMSLKPILKYFIHMCNEICKQNGTNESRTIGYGSISNGSSKNIDNEWKWGKRVYTVQCACRYRTNNSLHSFSPPSTHHMKGVSESYMIRHFHY